MHYYDSKRGFQLFHPTCCIPQETPPILQEVTVKLAVLTDSATSVENQRKVARQGEITVHFSTNSHKTIMESVSAPLRCFGECHAAEKYTDDGVETVTSVEQVN